MPPAPVDFHTLRPAQFTPRERRVKLAISGPEHLRGRGLHLGGHVDATHNHHAFHLCLGGAGTAIEVAFADAGGCVCVWGHHTLGYTLDNWDGKHACGTRVHMSNWTGEKVLAWQFNEDDWTISPRGSRHVVLGWGDDSKSGAQARLVSSTDPCRLRFDRNNRLAAPPPLRLQLGFKYPGQGLGLQDAVVDAGITGATNKHKACHARICSADAALDVELDASDHLVVVGGHAVLGFGLDERSVDMTPGSRCYFSNWVGEYGRSRYQINGMGGLFPGLTISPHGHPSLVLGWSSAVGALSLVRPDSPDRLLFPNPREKNSAEDNAVRVAADASDVPLPGATIESDKRISPETSPPRLPPLQLRRAYLAFGDIRAPPTPH
jgi:hypothetical protein